MIHADPNAKWRRFKFTVDKNVDDSDYYLTHKEERHKNPAFKGRPFYGYIRRDRIGILDWDDRGRTDEIAREVELVHGYTIETLVRDYEAEGVTDLGRWGIEDLEQHARINIIMWAVGVITGQIRVEQWGKIGDTDKVALKIIDPNGKILLDDIPELDAEARLPPIRPL